MSFIMLLSTFIIMIFAWVFLFPHKAYPLVSALERGWRQYLVRRGGERLAKGYFEDFRREALILGIDMHAIKAAIAANWEFIVEELGQAAVEEIFGPPQTLF